MSLLSQANNVWPQSANHKPPGRELLALFVLEHRVLLQQQSGHCKKVLHVGLFKFIPDKVHDLALQRHKVYDT